MLRATFAVRVRVLVLTMQPSGGALAPALERLGYKPYCFKHVYQRGNASTHPNEWAAVLEGKKHFNLKLLGNKFDCIVGPPAAIAFDRVLRDCPSFTKVVLVEEADKEGWARDVEQHITPLLEVTKKTSKRSIGKYFHTMIELMLPNDKKLGRAAALEMFEERAKRSIPEERLLVYQHGDGWGPLCAFLGKEVPADDIPFPPEESNNFECCSQLEDRMKRAENLTMYVTVVFVLMSAIMFWPVLNNIWGVVQEYYADYRLAFSTEGANLQREGREKDMTLRKAMVLSKKVTMDFEEKWQGKSVVGAGDSKGGRSDVGAPPS